MKSIYDIVVKIGSMALIRPEDGDIDYNIFSRLGSDLRPGMLLVSSGATEIGRIDYQKRCGKELKGDDEDIKTDYAAQGQSILMQTYRQYINPAYSLRQVLVEHSHFNDAEKREHILKLLLRAPAQNAIPIINYNDPVSSEENRKMELKKIGNGGREVVECVDNDETAAVVAMLVRAKTLVILTSLDGIYKDRGDASTLIHDISGHTPKELEQNVARIIDYCTGASRAGANGAGAKLKYSLGPAKKGTHVYIAKASSRVGDIISGKANSTHIYIQE
ncbi:MAG: uridylate kinase [Eubacteriales bacterium]|nr:uridylate kinase [Eubacteriales bacterium]